MTLQELLTKLSGCDPSKDVFVSQAFIQSNQVIVREIEVNSKGIILKDHYSRLPEPETFTAFNGQQFEVPSPYERMVGR